MVLRDEAYQIIIDGTDKERAMLDEVRRTIEDGERGPYAVVATAYHRGGLVSRHRTLQRAIRAALRWRMSDCTCGCCGIIPARDYDALPESSDAARPYDLAR